jgi:hypothetical protein
VKTKKSSKEKSIKKSAKKPANKKTNAAQKAGAKASAETDQLLTGWPSISKYLGQPTSVAQRWAKSGMPVERKGRSMTAKPEELNKWLGKEAGTKEPVHIAQTSDEDLLKDLRRGLKQARVTKPKQN